MVSLPRKLTFWPWEYERLRLRLIPLMVSNVVEVPFWSAKLKSCREFAAAANAAGGLVEVASLPDLGIRGNSHMLMQDKNNLQLADLILDWIDKHVENKNARKR